MSKSDVPLGLPTLADSSFDSSGLADSILAAQSQSILLRSPGVVCDHSSNAARAAATAASTSATPPLGTWAMTSSVAGLMTGVVSPVAASAHSPLMNIRGRAAVSVMTVTLSGGAGVRIVAAGPAHPLRSVVMDMLARWARPLALVSALLLLVGVTLTGLNLLLVGWSVYAVGHVAATAAFVAICAANRGRMEPWTWLGLGVLVVGMVLGLPQVASIWQDYATGGSVLPVAERAMELPVWTAPLGLTAELVTWVGVAFFGLAARGARVLPTGSGWMLLGAAVIGVIAALNIVSPYTWVVAVLLVALVLLGVGVALRQTEAQAAAG